MFLRLMIINFRSIYVRVNSFRGLLQNRYSDKAKIILSRLK